MSQTTNLIQFAVLSAAPPLMTAGDFMLLAGVMLGGLALLGMAAACLWLAWEQRGRP